MMTDYEDIACRHAGELLADIAGALAEWFPMWEPYITACSLMTGGPTWTFRPASGVQGVTCGYEPATDTWRVWRNGNSWSGVGTDRLDDALAYHLAHVIACSERDLRRSLAQIITRHT